MGNEAIRTFNQYIELKIEFEQPIKGNNIWSILYEHDVGLKTISQSNFHFNNFTNEQYREEYHVTSILTENVVKLSPAEWKGIPRRLLNNLVGGSDRWSYEKVKVPRSTFEDFKPYYFAIRERVFTMSPIRNWYSHQKDNEFWNDLRFQLDDDSEEWANIYNMAVTTSYTNRELNIVSGLEFKVQIRTQHKDLLDGCENHINELILGTIVNACKEVGPITHSLSCAGEIEVEKAVSCNRFTVPDEEE